MIKLTVDNMLWKLPDDNIMWMLTEDNMVWILTKDNNMVRKWTNCNMCESELCTYFVIVIVNILLISRLHCCLFLTFNNRASAGILHIVLLNKKSVLNHPNKNLYCLIINFTVEFLCKNLYCWKTYPITGFLNKTL